MFFKKKNARIAIRRVIIRSYNKISKILKFSPKANINNKIRNKADFDAYCKKHKKYSNLARKLNNEFIKKKKENEIIWGVCTHCNKLVTFEYDFIPGMDFIVYREKLACPICTHSNRARAMLYVLKTFFENKKDLNIYMYEQVTAYFKTIERLYGDRFNVIGSEFLGYDIPSGTVINGLRHEDALNLSFEDESLDVMISCDVFEHVPDLRIAFKEAYRVLKKGGVLFATIPIDPNLDKSILRAKIENNEIIHILEPEMHGNPLSEDGSLAFYNLGWDVFDMQKEAGFKDPYLIPIYDRKAGHIDYYPIMIFVAQK